MRSSDDQIAFNRISCGYENNTTQLWGSMEIISEAKWGQMNGDHMAMAMRRRVGSGIGRGWCVLRQHGI